MTRVAFTILGEPASKSNSREIVKRGDRPMSIKSSKALGFEAFALRQIPASAKLRIEGPVEVIMKIYYSSLRPDLDESLILDVLQDRWSKTMTRPNGTIKERQLLQSGVYRNDRQVWHKDIWRAIDKHNPRTDIVVENLYDQLLLAGIKACVPFIADERFEGVPF